SNREAAFKAMNDWISQQTKGKIQNLVQPDAIQDLTRLFLVNAIYFEGNWKLPFEKAATETQPFYGFDSQSEVPLIWRVHEKCRHARIGAVQLVELPYADSSMAMTIILPASGSEPFKQLQSKL